MNTSPPQPRPRALVPRARAQALMRVSRRGPPQLQRRACFVGRRPVFWDFEADENTWGIDDSYMFGPDYLVAPVPPSLPPSPRLHVRTQPAETDLAVRMAYSSRPATQCYLESNLNRAGFWLHAGNHIERGEEIRNRAYFHARNSDLPKKTVQKSARLRLDSR